MPATDIARARELLEQAIEKAVDGAIAAATSLGYLEALRARLAGDKPAVTSTGKKVHRRARTGLVRPQTSKRSAPASPAKRSAGAKPRAYAFASMPGFESWRAKIMEPVLRLPKKRGGGRDAAMQALIDGVHRLPDGTKGKIGRTQLYGWLRELDGGRAKGAAKERTVTPRSPRAAPATADEDEPVETPRSMQHYLGGAGVRGERREQREKRLTAEAELLELQRAGKVGRPLQLAPGYDDDTRRRNDCPAYKACLTFAADQKWQSFTCDGCSGPGEQNEALVQRRGRHPTELLSRHTIAGGRPPKNIGARA